MSQGTKLGFTITKCRPRLKSLGIWLWGHPQLSENHNLLRRTLKLYFSNQAELKSILFVNTVTAKWYTGRNTLWDRVFEKLAAKVKNRHQAAPWKRSSRQCIPPLLEWNFFSILHTARILSPLILHCFCTWKWSWKENGLLLMRAWGNEHASLSDETWQSCWCEDWFRRMQKCIECGGNYVEKMKHS